MATLEITRGSSPALAVTIREAGGAAPMDLTGLPLAIIDEDMPITLAIAVTNALAGEATITFPDTSDLVLGRSYGFRVQVGVTDDPGTFVTKQIEVVAT